MSIRPPLHCSGFRLAVLAGVAGLVAVSVAGAGPAVAGPAHSARAASLLSASGPVSGRGLLSVAQAGVRARASGRSVVASGLTSATSLTTVRPDGRVTVTESLLPIRAWRDGRWRALDPVLRAGPGHTVVPAVTAGGLVLSGGGRRPLAVMDDHGRALSVWWPGRLPVPVLSGATATYAGVLPGVDLVVTATARGGFSDVLVVTSARAAADPGLARLVLRVRAPGLRVTAVRGGGLAVAAAVRGRPVFTAAPPVMWDSGPLPAGTRTVRGPGGQVLTARGGLPARASAAGPGAGSAVSRVPVSVSGGSIVLAPPRSALAGRGRVYPVYIDPSFEPDPVGENAANWTQVDSGFPTTSYWDESEELQLGLCDFSGCNGLGVARSFFTLPYPSQITTATSIDSAYLYMTDIWSASCTPESVYLYTTSAISPSTTWYNQPSFAPHGYTESFAFQDTSGNACPDYGNDVTWNVLSSAQGDQAGQVTSQAYGMTAGDEGNDLYWKQFNSGSGNLFLSITYHNPPAKPASLQNAPGGACQTSYAGQALIGDDDITLYATVGDADNGDGDATLTTTFTVKSYATGATVDTITDQTGNAPGGVTAQTTIPRATVAGWSSNGATTAYSYYWYAVTSDAGSPVLTGPQSATCYFQFNPLGPAAVTVTLPSPDQAQVGGTITATFNYPKSCGTQGAGSCPASYTYQAGVAAPVTVNPNNTPAAGDWTGPIRVTQVGPIQLTVYGRDAYGNPGPPSQGYSFTGTKPAIPFPAGNFTGGKYPSLLTTGTGAEQSLWLSPGTGNGALGPPVDIGGLGTGINPGTDGPGDWNGAQVRQGNFLGDNIQDVLAYYPSGQHAGTAVVISGSAAAAPLQPGNITAIPAGTQFADPSVLGNPTTLVAAGNASETGAGDDDIIGVIGAGSSSVLDLFSTSAAGDCTGGDIGVYGYCQLLSGRGPDAADTSWADYALAAAELPDTTHPSGDPANIALFALNTKDGTLYQTTNPSLSSATPVGSGTWTKLTVPWGTTPPQLATADINGAGKTELWTLSGTTATPYLVSGTSVTPEGSGPATLSYPGHNWPLTNSGDYGTTGACTPKTAPATTPDTTTGTTATITGSFTWGCDDTFGTDLSLNSGGGSGALATSGPVVNTTGSYTVSAWVKVPTMPTWNWAVVAQDGTNVSGFCLGYWHGAGWTFRFATSDAMNPGFTSIQGPAAQPGAWTNLVGVYNASNQTAQFYVNGAFEGTTSFAAWNATGPFTIGRDLYNGAGSDYLSGSIADVQTWNTAFSTAQISALYSPMASSSPPAAGQLAGTAEPTAVQLPSGVVAIYRTVSDGTIWSANQTQPGGSFNSWQQVSPAGTTFTSQPAAVQNAAGAVSLYALTKSGTVMSSTQSGPGEPFSTWQTVGSGNPDLVTPPDVLLLSDGVVAVYAVDNNGNIWGTNQNGAGGAFYPWQQLSSGLSLRGEVASFQNAAGEISLYALTSAGSVVGATQAGVGGPFSTWIGIGSGNPDLVTPPDVLVLSDGVVAVYAVDSNGNIWGTNQNTAGGSFIPWQQLSSGLGFQGEVASFQNAAGVVSLYALTKSGSVVGSTQAGVGGPFSTWIGIGGNNPDLVTPPDVLFSDDLVTVYAADTNGNTWGTNQNTAGGPFIAWQNLLQ